MPFFTTGMKDISKKNDKELHSLLNEKREALRNFRFASAGSSQKNVREGRAARRDIARVLTALKAKPKA